VLIVLAAPYVGTLFGIYMLKLKLGPYPNYEPGVRLEYLYIRSFNTTVVVNDTGPYFLTTSFKASSSKGT